MARVLTWIEYWQLSGVEGSFEDCIGHGQGGRGEKTSFTCTQGRAGPWQVGLSHKHQLLLKSSLHWNKKPFCFPTQRCYDLMAAAAGCRLHHFRRNWKFWIVFCRQIFLLNATIFQGFKVFIFKPWFIHAFSISSSPNEHYLSGHYLNVFLGM